MLLTTFHRDDDLVELSLFQILRCDPVLQDAEVTPHPVHTVIGIKLHQQDMGLFHPLGSALDVLCGAEHGVAQYPVSVPQKAVFPAHKFQCLFINDRSRLGRMGQAVIDASEVTVHDTSVQRVAASLVVDASNGKVTGAAVQTSKPFDEFRALAIRKGREETIPAGSINPV